MDSLIAPTLCRLIMTSLLVLLGLASHAAEPPATGRLPLPYTIRAQMPDVAQPAPLSHVSLGGYLGTRIDNNEKNRLLLVDEDPLLAGFRHRPGSHPWIGEHVGKWLHAATLAWAYTGDARLRTKLDRVAHALVTTQEPDGYLGTYMPDKRFGLSEGADWDVWSHKYNLIGLLTYYQYTGSLEALATCRKMGDLLCRTFGPGKKSILAAGTHQGMAATSVLEPMVLLYRTTGDKQYLAFCRYLVTAWEEPGGPRLLTALTARTPVGSTANGKAYEMLSNLVGLCELARATGDRRYLTPAVNAWQDITRHQRYLTGTASYKEHFHDANDLPNTPGADIGETCVTVTWIQLNAQLLSLTGQARYGDEIERSLYNHLAAAQRPDGKEWCYYTALEGTKPYGPGISCCVSSGPRGMALAPQFAYLTTHQAGHDTLSVNLFDSSRATIRLGRQAVTAQLQSAFPRAGHATLTFHLTKPVTFAVQVRSPQWAQTISLQPTGSPASARYQNGWTQLPPRRWKNGDTVQIRFSLKAQMVRGEYGNQGRATLTWGPFVMAYDQAWNAYLPPIATMSFKEVAPTKTRLLVASSSAALLVSAPVQSSRRRSQWSGVFTPFADAGAGGQEYRVWLPLAGVATTTPDSLLTLGQESRSNLGNLNGSINDGSLHSFVVTYDGKPQPEAWFAVTLDQPTTIRRIVFAHGHTFHDGGWFNTTNSKPRLEIQRTKNGAWESLGTLDTYPATTATAPQGLRDSQFFTLSLPTPQQITGLRIIGTPACGDTPIQAFASCAELQAFPK